MLLKYFERFVLFYPFFLASTQGWGIYSGPLTNRTAEQVEIWRFNYRSWNQQVIHQSGQYLCRCAEVTIDEFSTFIDSTTVFVALLYHHVCPVPAPIGAPADGRSAAQKPGRYGVSDTE